MKNNIYFRLIICLCFLTTTTICYSQEEYEDVYISSWKWTNNDELKYYSNSINKLQVYNYNALTRENKKDNTWPSKLVWLSIPIEGSKAYTITFNIKNEHNPRYYKYKVWGKDKKGNLKEEWHNTNIYWGVMFEHEDKYGSEQVYTINYNNENGMNFGYTYTSVNYSDSKIWQPAQDIETRTIKIEYDGRSTAKIYTGYGQTLTKTFYNTKGLTRIGIKLGPASQILVTNFKFHRQTAYGAALPEINRAHKEIQDKRYNNAIAILTKVIETYKGALPYLYRAQAYFGNENYNSAIEDCYTGLYFSEQKETKDFFNFIIGISKLCLNDDTGVEDLRLAGEKGLSFLRENNLLDYKPGQNTSQDKRNVSHSRKIDSKSLRSSNRIPLLKKNK